MATDGRCWVPSDVTESLLPPKSTAVIRAAEKQIEKFEKGEFTTDDQYPFPKSAICVLATKIFERFAYNAARAVLVMYLTTQLAFSSQDATIIYHSFNTTTFLMCVFGAIISDSWLGKYRTVLYVSIAYAIGMLLLNLGSIPPLGLPAREFTFIAMLLISAGSGGLKPCLMALGGDQFRRPEQDRQLDLFYSLMYMTLKIGYLFGTAVTPILRNDVKCFGNDHCFPLAFGAPGSFMLLALVSFLLGSKLYVKKEPSGNILFRVIRCVWFACIMRWRNGKTDPKPHWLDHAESKYGLPLVNDIKVLLNVIVMFIPIPMFYALNEQTGSRWTLQATYMDGDVGFYNIKPDQMQVFMPFMVLVFIILLDSCVYKQMERIGIKGPLQRMLFGTCMSAIAFVIAGTLELQIERTLAVHPLPGHAQVRMFNSIPCGVKISSTLPGLNNIVLPSMDMYKVDVPVLELSSPFAVRLEPDSLSCQVQSITMNLTTETSTSYLIRDSDNIAFKDSASKNLKGLATLRILWNDPSGARSLSIVDISRNNHTVTRNSYITSSLLLRASNYAININNRTWSKVELGPGSVTTILFGEADGSPVTNTFEITPPNTVHMLCMIPQYVFLAMGEAMVAVTGLKFAYSEAPNSMKTVVQAIFLFTISGGNMIDIIIVGANVFRSQANLTFFFAGLMFVDIIFFVWLVRRYKHKTTQQESFVDSLDSASK